NGNYNLLASSMLINAGHPDSTDSDGTRADIGAYPYLNTYSGDNGWHVSTSGNDTSGTGDPGDPFRSIQGGINFANVADSVFVAAGTYMENILIPNFRSGLVIKSDFGPDTTVIDGNGLGTVIDAETCCPDNITIDGFTITGGQGENGNYYSGINATLITQSTFKNLILTGNSNGNVFSVSPHSNKLENILIADNTNTNFQLNENAFKALNIIGSAQDNESITVANVTIANNTNLAGLGIHQSHGQDLNAILLNTAVWGNDQSIIIHSDNNPYLSVNESLIEDDLGGVYHPEENATINWSVVISSAPHFYAPTEGDYSLSDWSPLIGAGAPQQTENDTVYYAPETDILGNPRPNPAGSNPDIGAYEHELGGFNNLPIVSLDLEIREHHDMVPLSFSMEDLDDDSMSYVFFYSLDSLEWDTAAVSEVTSPALPRGTAAGIGKGGTVVSLGAPRRFSTDMEMEWDSRLDLGDVHAMEVWLKTTVSDGELYTTKIAGPISVDNFIGSVVFIDSLSGEVSGPVNISYNLTDPTNDEYTMAIQYSTDGGSSWMEPTLSSPISDPLLPSEYSGERTWHTEIDLANADEQVLLALSITDGWQYGSADTVEFVVDNQFLIGLASYAPDTADKLNWYDNFVLFFPGEVDQTTLESGISLEGTVSGLVAASYNTATIGTQIRLSIIPDQALYGGEEVTLTISTEVKDTLGNPYDGNLNGDVDGDLDVTVLAYEMALLGDYNYSGLIQFNDLLDFQQAWWNPSTYGGRETGPAEGSAPNLSIQPDGVIDFEDLMVFVQMWNWSAGYVSNDGWLAKSVSSEFSGTTVEAVFPQKQIGEELETIHITMDVDSLKAIGSGEIMISYDPAVLEFLRIQNSLDEQWIILSNAADTDGMLRINLADFGRDENSGSRILNLEFKTLNEQNTFIFWQTDFRGRAAEIWEQSSGHLDFSTVPPLPQVYSLHQNFPNPFNPSTTIRYDLPEDAFVRLTVYDIRGREVAVLANGMKAAGYQTVVWNGRDSRGIPASAGIYFLRINTPAFHATKKMMLLK
ncbi:MAG: choice-of-anchor Q domain-containing protein, partial [Candidatus Marinimicrobia bacterium]|nr:choice-of-anchor Q domain-containing protein [Candidatus Neomarinimicrobiota bacterium]